MLTSNIANLFAKKFSSTTDSDRNGTANLYRSSLSYEGSSVISFRELSKVVLKLKDV